MTAVQDIQPARRGRAGRPARLAVLAAVVGAVSGAFWPGHMSGDTITMLRQVRDGATLTDFHTPVLVGLWRAAWEVLPGPWWALVATVATFVGSVYVLVRAVLRPWWAVAATAAVTASPMMLGYLGVHSRDTWFMVLTLASFAALLRAGQVNGRARTGLVVAGLAASWLAMGARQNGAPVALVATMVGVGLLRAGRPAPRRRRDRLAGPAIAVGVFASLVASQLLVVRLLLRPEPRHPEQTVLLFDLIGMSVRTGGSLLPPEVHPGGDVVALRVRASDSTIAGAIFGDGAVVRFPVPEAHLDELREAWWEAVRGHPSTWFDTRWDQWLAQLGWSRNVQWIQHPAIDPNPWGYRPSLPDADEAATGYVTWFASTPALDGGLVHEVWAYLLVDLAAVAYLRSRDHRRRVAGAVALAAVLYEGTLLAVGAGGEYRFGLLTVASGLVACVLLGHDLAVAAAAHRARATVAPTAGD